RKERMTTVSSGQTHTVSSGQTDVGDIVLAGGTLEVLGGVTSDTTLSGVTVGTQVANEFVHSNGSALGTTVENFAVLVVGSGGFANGTIVNSGGHENVDGGLASGTAVNAGGFDLIYDNGTTSNTIVNGGAEVVEGIATGLISGTAVSTTVNRGGDQIVFGVADFTMVNGGFEVVWSGGVSESATINSGGFDFILGTAIGDVINGGTEFVGSGGSASFITVNSGGVEVVGGLATV